jgi:hypothetical protein
MSIVTVITHAVYSEAKKWSQLSFDVEPIKNAVDGLTLGAAAFFIGDLVNAEGHAQAYHRCQSFMSHVLGGAVVEFDQLGGALDSTAEAYERADEIVSLDLDKIYGAEGYLRDNDDQTEGVLKDGR